MQLHHPEKLQRLISDFGKMKLLDGYTAQSRGQAFNALIADMFACWGLEAEPNIRHGGGKGETDIIATINSRHYIIEAKWERTKSDAGQIAKLKYRLEQRIEGTIGIFISMKGFSSEVTTGLPTAGRINVLCLDAHHIEAMLSGFIPPEEMITKLLQKASHEGIAYSALENLYREKPFTSNEIEFTTPPELKSIIDSTPANFGLETVLSNIPFGQHGIAAPNDDELIITTIDGLYLINHKKNKIRTLLNLPHCQGSAIFDNDGNIFIRRHTGVGKLSNGKLICIGGGLLFGSNLMLKPDNTISLFSYTSLDETTSKTILSSLHTELGFQQSNPIDVQPFNFSTGCYSSDGALVIFGNGGILMFSQGIQETIRNYQTNIIINPNGITRHSDHEFYICGNDTTIFKFNSKTKELAPFLHLKLPGSCHAICHSPQNEFYYWGHYAVSPQDMKGCVLRWSLPKTGDSF